MARRARKPVVETFALGGHIHWEVRWVTTKDGDYRIHVKDCEHDLGLALSTYERVRKAGRKLVTLRSCNVGFPPPEKYQEYWITKHKKVRNSAGKLRREAYYVHKVPMRKLNRKGVFWCPYCRELRRFQEQGGFYIDGVVVPESGLHCPICGVSHRDHHVRKWNPEAQKRLYRGR